MKKLVVCAIAILATAPLYAQSYKSKRPTTTSTTTVSNTLGASAVSGIHVELTKPMFDMKLSGGGVSAKSDMESLLGLSVGYKNISVGQLGFIGGGTFVTGKLEEAPGSWNFLKLDGNAAIGINEFVHLKGGLNLSQLVSGPANSKDVIDKPGIGYQLGAGFQINQTVSVDIKYVSMKQEGKVNGVSLELEESGIELGVGATF